jgi:hypothetical protein
MLISSHNWHLRAGHRRSQRDARRSTLMSLIIPIQAWGCRHTSHRAKRYGCDRFTLLSSHARCLQAVTIQCTRMLPTHTYVQATLLATTICIASILVPKVKPSAALAWSLALHGHLELGPDDRKPCNDDSTAVGAICHDSFFRVQLMSECVSRYIHRQVAIRIRDRHCKTFSAVHTTLVALHCRLDDRDVLVVSQGMH